MNDKQDENCLKKEEEGGGKRMRWKKNLRKSFSTFSCFFMYWSRRCSGRHDASLSRYKLLASSYVYT